MKKIFLYAYDKMNLGDDLFIHTITKRYLDVQFYLWTSKENKATFRSLNNLKVIDQESNWMKLLGKIRPSLPVRYKARLEKKCDAVIFIGGSLFIEYDNWENILNWWEYEANNRPFYVLGANFGPYKSEAYKIRLNSIYSKMKDVCFRDSYSYQMFEGNCMVRYAPDILFSCDIPMVKRVKKQIFVSVIDLLSKNEGSSKLLAYHQEYIDRMIQIIKGYLNEEYTIVLSSFCKEEGDENAIEKIVASFDYEIKEKIRVVNYIGTNSQEILLAIAESEAIIASRFHAMILGIAAGKPVFPIIYSDKTKHVLEDIWENRRYGDVRELDKVSFDIVKTCLKEEAYQSVRDLREEAKRHFENLDQLLM